MEKDPDAFRTISEVGEELDVPQHVLRFWETRFSQIRPMKRGGGRRYYRVNDVELLKGIHHLLYGKGYTIKGVQRILKERGVAHVTDVGRGVDEPEQELATPVAQTEIRQKPRPQPIPIARPPANPQLTPANEETLKLALTDLAAAKRLLGTENKS